jgi:hypothetical protein
MTCSLDYFKLYDVENLAVKYRVALKGQFDQEPVKAEIPVLDLFANTVSKNGERLFDKSAHFTAYRLFQEKPEPLRTVSYANQFGEGAIRTANAFGLLVPAMKRESGLELSKQLSHFKVYWVAESGKPVDKVIKLRDQFRAEEVTVGAPIFFAVPVAKQAGRRAFPITNERAHLVIYRITPKAIQKKITAKDQLKEYGLTVVRSLFLAVPSLKIRWKAG